MYTLIDIKSHNLPCMKSLSLKLDEDVFFLKPWRR